MTSATPIRKNHRWLRLAGCIAALVPPLLFNGLPAAVAKPPSVECANVRLTGILPRPHDKTRATQQTITLDANCHVVAGSVQEIPISAITSLPSTTATRRLPDVTNQGTNDLVKQVGTLATFTNQIHSKNEVWDCCGVMLTGLYSSDAWSGDWTRITSYNVQGSTAWHTESNGFPGWYLVKKSSTGGCTLPCSSANFHQHAEWGYQGFFDTTGSAFYNILDNYQMLNGNSSSSCTFNLYARRWFSAGTPLSWQWVKTCH